MYHPVAGREFSLFSLDNCRQEESSFSRHYLRSISALRRRTIRHVHESSGPVSAGTYWIQSGPERQVYHT